jgi:hypothetical protein
VTGRSDCSGCARGSPRSPWGFAAPQLPLFPGRAEGLEPDALIERVQPDEGLSLRFGAKVPGHVFLVQRTSMNFSCESSEEQSPDAYERVILDALIGDPTYSSAPTRSGAPDRDGRSARLTMPASAPVGWLDFFEP